MKIEYSASYMMLLDLLFKTNLVSRTNMYSTTINGNKIVRNKLNEKTDRIQQELTITDISFLEKCTVMQHHVICIIQYQLKEYNALWECPAELKRSSASRQAIKGLIEMKVLIKTETTNIYIVNPLYIRRGDFHAVLMTTANMLSNISKVTPLQISNKKPVKEFIGPEIKEKAICYGFNGNE